MIFLWLRQMAIEFIINTFLKNFPANDITDIGLLSLASNLKLILKIGNESSPNFPPEAKISARIGSLSACQWERNNISC